MKPSCQLKAGSLSTRAKKQKRGEKKQNQTTEKQSANIIISKNYFPKSG